MSEVRVRNETGSPLDDVRVTPSAAAPPVSVGPLGPGSASGWHRVAGAARYPSVEASGPGGDLVHRPLEDAGRATLPEGRYTYVLRLEGGRLVVGMEEDPG